MASVEKERDKSKVHKLSLKGSAKLVAEFVSVLGETQTPTRTADNAVRIQFQYSIHTILYVPGPSCIR